MSKASDAAYEREMAQRALVLVLAAAEMWRGAPWPGDPQEDDRPERDELNDAIERVRASFLKITGTPKPTERILPGQINLFDGSIETCPKCGKYDPWAALARGEGDPAFLQCGNCAHVLRVSERTYDGIVACRRREHGHTDTVKSPVIPEKMGRSRGAG